MITASRSCSAEAAANRNRNSQSNGHPLQLSRCSMVCHRGSRKIPQYAHAFCTSHLQLVAPLGKVGAVEVPVLVVPVVQVMGADPVGHRGTIRSTARSFLLRTAAPVACPWYTETARWMYFGKAFRMRRRHIRCVGTSADAGSSRLPHREVTDGLRRPALYTPSVS